MFCDADADVIERELEKAQPQENSSTQSARRPAMYDQRIFSGKWRKRALCFAGTLYVSPVSAASSELLRGCSFCFGVKVI